MEETAWVRRLRAAGLLVLRVASGATMAIAHGWPKLAAFGEKSATFPDPLGVGPRASMALAIFGELFCAALLVPGLATRLAAVPALVTMLVAAFVQHAADPFGKKELALLYAAGFLTLALTGAGDWSVDALVVRWWKKRRAAGP